jgi:Formin Homology 2 Domain
MRIIASWMHKNCAGDKHVGVGTHRYFMHVMDMPRIAERLACVIFMRTFAGVVGQVRHHVELLDAAVREVRACSDLRLFLQHVLAVGNRLNMGTRKGAAQARRPPL